MKSVIVALASASLAMVSSMASSIQTFELRDSTPDELAQAMIYCQASDKQTMTLVNGDLAEAINSQEQPFSLRLLLLGSEGRYSLKSPISLNEITSLELCAAVPAPGNRTAIAALAPSDGGSPLNTDIITLQGESELTLQNLVIDAFFWGSHCAVMAIKQGGHLRMTESSIIRLVNAQGVPGVYSIIYMGKHNNGGLSPALTVEGTSSVLAGNSLKVIHANDANIIFNGGIITESGGDTLYLENSVLTLNGTQLLFCPSLTFNLDQVLPLQSMNMEESCLYLNGLHCSPPNLNSLALGHFINAKNSEILMTDVILTGRRGLQPSRPSTLRIFFNFDTVTINNQSQNNLYFESNDFISPPPPDIVSGSSNHDNFLNSFVHDSGLVTYTLCSETLIPPSPTPPSREQEFREWAEWRKQLEQRWEQREQSKERWRQARQRKQNETSESTDNDAIIGAAIAEGFFLAAVVAITTGVVCAHFYRKKHSGQLSTGVMLQQVE